MIQFFWGRTTHYNIHGLLFMLWINQLFLSPYLEQINQTVLLTSCKKVLTSGASHPRITWSLIWRISSPTLSRLLFAGESSVICDIIWRVTSFLGPQLYSSIINPIPLFKTTIFSSKMTQFWPTINSFITMCHIWTFSGYKQSSEKLTIKPLNELFRKLFFCIGPSNNGTILMGISNFPLLSPSNQPIFDIIEIIQKMPPLP